MYNDFTSLVSTKYPYYCRTDSCAVLNERKLPDGRYHAIYF